MGVLIGMIMTMVVQSSSATIGVLQSLASQRWWMRDDPGFDSLAAAVPILLGDNIGTTIGLASIGANRTAKRAALSHPL